MATNRRGFLGLLGGAPFAAKGVLNQSAVLSAAPPSSPYPNTAGIMASGSGVNQIARSAIQKIIGVGIPEFKLREMRNKSQYIDRVDPDIMALRSVSDSRKIAMQRDRNFERQKRTFLERWLGPDDDQARQAFYEKTGWYL